MNTSMKLRFFAAPVGLALLGLPAFGCDQVAEAQGTLCCTDFKVGEDLSAVNWDVEASAAGKFGAFMQATADFAGTATSVANEVGAACHAIAVDLKADVNAVKETDAAKRTEAWCKLAVTQIKDTFKTGKLVIVAQPPQCSFNANIQANCEAKCSVMAECEAELGDITARCEPGKLSGKCTGMCTGSCDGSANLAVTCEGKCAGTCEGKCDGACSKSAAGGDCRGSCEGTCAGECRGSCAIDAKATAKCEGDCTGKCDVEFIAPKCKAELTPPSAKCEGSAECSGSCKASASAKAECTEPSLEVAYDGTEQNLDVAIASLKMNLPKIVAAVQGRGKLLVENAETLVSLTANVVTDAKSLSAKAGLCAIPAADALATAANNLSITVQASADLASAVGMPPAK